jgi:N6-L-threonylcarbamoyladenine synthase
MVGFQLGKQWGIQPRPMTLILAIETSCDETAAAVVADGHEIRSNVVASQVDLHRRYGGVFPELASRQHVLAIQPVIEQAMEEAGADWDDLAAIAVTHGPGLAGSLLVGVNVAKGLAYGRGLPLIGVNHLEAHIATNWLDVAVQGQGGVDRQGDQLHLPELDGRAVAESEGAGGDSDETFPLLCLVVSGGHTELVLMQDYGVYHRLGGTIDDAVGEAFDKVARLLGLEYPGGPAIQRIAEQGNPALFPFPRARLDRSYDFSFSGLKTAVLREVQKYEPDLQRPGDKTPASEAEGTGPGLHPKTAANMAAGFQEAVVDVLVEKTVQAASEYKVNGVLMAGGVAANRRLREKMSRALEVPLRMPPIALATDNATGVGVVGYWALRQGRTSDWDLDVVPGLKLT